MRTEPLLIMLIFLALITGCDRADYFLNPPSRPTDGGEDLEGNLVKKGQAEFPHIQHQLVELIKSPNPQELAEQYGIYYQDGKVRVVIILTDKNDQIAERFDLLVEATSENMVQALVLLTQLGELSNEPYVKFIQLPCKPKLHE
jgi:hypothetical protein